MGFVPSVWFDVNVWCDMGMAYLVWGTASTKLERKEKQAYPYAYQNISLSKKLQYPTMLEKTGTTVYI